jgi:hypothetical protein
MQTSVKPQVMYIWYGAAGSTNTTSDVLSNNPVTTVILAYHNNTQQPLKIQSCYVFTQSAAPPKSPLSMSINRHNQLKFL